MLKEGEGKDGGCRAAVLTPFNESSPVTVDSRTSIRNMARSRQLGQTYEGSNVYLKPVGQEKNVKDTLYRDIMDKQNKDGRDKTTWAI